MKVADLFAKLSLKPDGASFKAGDRMIGGIRTGLRGLLGKGREGIAGLGANLKQGIGQGIGQGIFSKITGAVTGIADVERGLVRFKIAGDLGEDTMTSFRNALGETARASGVGRDKLLAGASAYQALTGDTASAIKATALFGKVANATGSEVEDIATVMAALKTNMGIQDQDMETAFSALHIQGKAGAVELKEQATLMSSILPLFTKFEGAMGVEGMKQAGAALQIARQTFGSASEAATGVKALVAGLTRGAAKLGKGKDGVKVFDVGKDGVKRMRSFGDILKGIQNSRFAKDEAALLTALGSTEALATYQVLSKNLEGYDNLIAKASDAGAIERDAATFRESAVGRFDRLIEKLKTTVTDLFTPERIDKLVSGLEGVAATMGSIVDRIGQVGAGAEWMGEGAARNLEGLGNLLGFISDDEMKERARMREMSAHADEQARTNAYRMKNIVIPERKKQAERLGIDATSAGWQDQLFGAQHAAAGMAIPPEMLTLMSQNFKPAVEAWKKTDEGKAADATTIGDLNNTINIIAKGGDPKEIALQVEDTMRKFWRDRMAEFEGGAAAEPPPGT